MMNPTIPPVEAIATLNDLRRRINSVLIGQQAVVDQVIIALLCDGHVLIEGVPGLGKTLLVRALAACFAGQFKRIQFTPDLMPADITGHVMFDMQNNSFRVRRGPVFTNLLLADEINRAPAKTQAALLEVMQEGQVSLEGQSHPLPAPFMVLATQNPIEQEGTYPLPEAELDRFLLKVTIDYPSLEDELAITREVTAGHIGDRLAVDDMAFMSPEMIGRLQQTAADISIDEQVLKYAVELVRATRDDAQLHRGAGSRGCLALVRCARAHALLQGRDFVTPDDVKAMAAPVLRHRIELNPGVELDGLNSESVLARLIGQVPAPRQ